MIENRMVCDAAWPLPNPSALAEARAERDARLERRFELVQGILTGRDERFWNVDSPVVFDYEQEYPVMLAVGRFLRDGNKDALLAAIEKQAWIVANGEVK